MGAELHGGVERDLEPRRQTAPSLHNQPLHGSESHEGIHNGIHDATYPLAPTSSVSHHAFGSPAKKEFHHPSAVAHRTAVMHAMQQGLGNHFVQSALRQGPGSRHKLAGKEAAKQGRSQTDAHANAKADAKVTAAADHKAQQATDDAVKAAPVAHASSRLSGHGGGTSGHSGPVAKAGTEAGTEARETHASSHTEPTAGQPPATVPGATVMQSAPAPQLDEIVIAEAEPLAIRFGQMPVLNLRLAPAPARPGQVDLQAAAPQDAIREATNAFTHLQADAEASHRLVLEQANTERRELTESGRTALLQVDREIEQSVIGLKASVAASRMAVMTAASGASRALEEQHEAAKRILGGASATARKRVATARASVDKAIDDIQNDLINKFRVEFDARADKLTTAATAASKTLRAPDTQAKVASQFTGLPDAAVGIQLAQEEAQRAAVPRMLNENAAAIEAGSKIQAEYLRRGLDNPQKDGTTIRSIVIHFGTTLKESAVGKGAGPPPPAPVQSGAKAAKPRDGALYDQASHAVDVAFTQAWHAMSEQFKAASANITIARDGALQQLSLQESVALEQFAALRKRHREAVQRGVRSGTTSLQEGAKAGLPGYADAVSRSAAALEDAALRGAEAMTRVAHEGLAGATRSVKEGSAFHLRRLQQVHAGAAATIASLPAAAGKEAGELALKVNQTTAAISEGVARSLPESTGQQAQAFASTAKAVADSASAYTQPLALQFKASVDAQKEAWFPDPKKQAQKQEATTTPDPASARPVQKSPEEVYADYAEHPKDKINDKEVLLAQELRKSLASRAARAAKAFGTFNLDENGLIAALRGVTRAQGTAVSVIFDSELGAGNLENKIQYEYDRNFVGLNRREYLAAINYLRGYTAAGALFELKTTEGIFSSEGGRAEEILRSLTKEQREQLVKRPDWPAVAGDVKDGLHGTDLDVFNALETSNLARAVALRAKEKVDKSRDSDDRNAYFTSIEQFDPLASLNPNEKVSFTDMQKEFAGLTGLLKPGETLDAARAAEIFRSYTTKPVTVLISNGEGDSTEVTYKIEGADLALAEALALHGPGSIEARAARVLRESDRKDGKPDQPALESAVVDPRLNPTLTPTLSKEARDGARKEQDEIFLKYAELARKYGIETNAHTAAEAREEAALKLKSHYDESDDKGAAGAQYVESIVKKDVPDGAAGLRYAILGLGTDEALIHRNLQRMSRAEVKNARDLYKTRYKGADLDSDLGTFGRSHFGDLSGDERLQAERELMGVPTNDRERVEVALFTTQQQLTETGFGASLLDVGDSSGSSKDPMKRNRRLLTNEVGGEIGVDDDFGTPTIKGGNFDSKGNYTGKDINELLANVDMAQNTSELYAAKVDELASAVVTAIAVAGAVVAAIATAGAASPLIVAAIAGGFGVAAMAANQMIRGGRYGWEEAAVDLGMTVVQAVSAGVGQSIALSAKAGVSAATTGVRALAAEEMPAAMSKAASSQLSTMVFSGAATGAIGGLGSTVLNEHTWDKGILDGIGESMLGMVKGSITGAATSAVAGGLENKLFGHGLQNLAAEGGVVEGGLNVVKRGLGRSVISGVSAVAGAGTDIAFDAATGRFHGSADDALKMLGTAGRDAALRGLLEGGGEAFGKRFENRATRPQSQDPARVRMEVVDQLPPQRDGSPAVLAIYQDAGGDAVIRVLKGTPPEVLNQAIAHELAAARATSEQTPRPEVEPRSREEQTAAPRPAAENIAEDPARLTVEPTALEHAAQKLVSPEATAEISPATNTEPAARVRSIDEEAAAGILGSRAAGDAAERFGVAPATLNTVEGALNRITREGGVAGSYGKLVEDEAGKTVVDLETRKRDANGETVRIKVRVEMVEANTLGSEPDGSIPVARFVEDGPSGYVVKVSLGAPAVSVERALAHELAEIRVVHGEREVAQSHALAARSTETVLSPHDHGRLAELAVLARQANLETPEGRRAFDEAQRLAAHLGLTGEREVAVRRRALAVGALDEQTGAFLKRAVQEAPENPFLKPLTGNAARDIELLGQRILSAQRTGELAFDAKTWLGQDETPRNPILIATIEQLRQALVGADIFATNRLRGEKAPSSGYNSDEVKVLRARFPKELGLVFDRAFSQAAAGGQNQVQGFEERLDPHTIAAARARFGEQEKFQDWHEFKQKYLEANPGRRHQTVEGEFADLKSLRTAFDSWAHGRYIPEGGSIPTSLLTDSLRPDPGYEARVFHGPYPALETPLPETMVVVRGKTEESIGTDAAVTKRNQLLEEAASLRERSDAQRKLGNDEAAEGLKDQAKDALAQVRPLSEAFGVLAGRAFAAQMFPDAIIYELHGAGVPDLVIERPDGSVIVFECKGGEAGLGTRLSVDGSLRVEQGTREYLESLVNTMKNSSNANDPKILRITTQLTAQLNDPSFNLEYYLINQQFEDGRPLKPSIARFDANLKTSVAPPVTAPEPTP